MSRSIVIPAYNSERMVSTLVDRLVASLVTLQIVLVNDGSADGTDHIQLRRDLMETSLPVLSGPSRLRVSIAL